MGLLFKRYKTKFRYTLKPVFVMLVAKGKELDKEQWLRLVNKSKESISANPEEYLGVDLPDVSLLKDILDEIFHEFLKERAYHDAASGQQVNFKGLSFT
jgi:hypothetical protein